MEIAAPEATCASASGPLGLPFAAPPPEPFKKRRFVLYVALGVATAGCFFAWRYRAPVYDPNTHFRNHMLVGDAMVKAFT